MFLSVPYAKPPIGELRWAAPHDIPPWSKTIETKIPPPPCPQMSEEHKDTMSENCLFMNIYKPVFERGSLLPIIVWLHGSDEYGVESGHATDDDYGILASMANAIVISVQYRLGIFGFLHANVTGVGGNWALLDQQLALQFITTESANIGGNRDKIILAGHSGGAMCVGYHMLNLNSTQLLSGAISHSGQAIFHSGLEEYSQSMLDQLADALGDGTDMSVMPLPNKIEHLRLQDMNSIITVSD